MDYQYYRDEYKGTVKEMEFYILFPEAKTVLKMYTDDQVRTDQLQDTLDGYGNFDKALCFEVDYIDQDGGITMMNGASNLDLKQVQPSGYIFQMGNGGQSYKGVPFSPLAKPAIMAELRRKGLFKLGWNW